MQLNNVCLVNEKKPVNISILNGKITAIGNVHPPEAAEDFLIDCNNALGIPGLINSHDHLDFNCFHPLGHNIYNNYTEWGSHIHNVYKENINAVLKIPQQLRTQWGMYKNLLAGVTTVVNHGLRLKIDKPLINILQDTENLHSVKFQKGWKWKLNNPFQKNKTCVIHAGEGTDKQSADEIDELLHWNLMQRKIVAVHAVAMKAMQAKHFRGIVWCPESNEVLLNQHADIKVLKENTTIVFGTDSTLTGHWNAWKHLRQARALKKVSDIELYEMITKMPAQLWKMNNGELAVGKDADIVIASQSNTGSYWDNFFSIDPSFILLLMHKGKIRLFDDSIAAQIKPQLSNLAQFSRVVVDGALKFVQGDLPALINDIKVYNPSVSLPVAIYKHRNPPCNA